MGREGAAFLSEVQLHKEGFVVFATPHVGCSWVTLGRRRKQISKDGWCQLQRMLTAVVG